MKRILSISLFSIYLSANAQIISTVAGNGTQGYNGDGGDATDASLFAPQGIAIDTLGNMYIADTWNSVIRKVSTSGVMSTIAGNGNAGYTGDGAAATNAELNLPSAVAVDKAGNIYIADMFNFCVRKVNKSGKISTVAGSGTQGSGGDGDTATSAYAQLNYPSGVAIDALGNIYIADQENNRIRKVDTTSKIINTVAGNGIAGFSGDGGIATTAQLNYPSRIVIDALGNIYIADQGNSRIRKVNTSGIINTIAGNGSENSNGTGTGNYSGDNGSALSAGLNLPSGVALDAAGNVYIADQENDRVRKVNTFGIISTIAGNGTQGSGGDDETATTAQLSFPTEVAVDTSGNIFIADEGNNRIRKVGNGSATGIGQITDKNDDLVSIYPNPSTGNFAVTFIRIAAIEKRLLQVFDMTGNLVLTETLETGNNRIDGNNLAQGVYTVSITGIKEKINKRLVIVR
jgi:sugar lactone lactonase YvrE